MPMILAAENQDIAPVKSTSKQYYYVAKCRQLTNLWPNRP